MVLRSEEFELCHREKHHFCPNGILFLWDIRLLLVI